MSVEQDLRDRGSDSCELCGGKAGLTVYAVAPRDSSSADNCVMTCETCHDQLTDSDKVEANHWRCLNDSMWSEFRAVKVIAWRILSRLRKEGWPQDLLDMLYLEDDDLRFAKETGEHLEEADKIIHRDANGAILQAGDSVVLIKDLKVKGSSLVAKQGTAVRRISLDHENAKYIEGKVGPTQIVIITDYVKKMSEKE